MGEDATAGEGERLAALGVRPIAVVGAPAGADPGGGAVARNGGGDGDEQATGAHWRRLTSAPRDVVVHVGTVGEDEPGCWRHGERVASEARKVERAEWREPMAESK